MTTEHTLGGKCFVCGKALGGPSRWREVVLQDDNYGHVYVGLDCFEHVVKAGYDGLEAAPKARRNGTHVRVFATTAMAEAYSRR